MNSNSTNSGKKGWLNGLKQEKFKKKLALGSAMRLKIQKAQDLPGPKKQ